MTRLSNDPADFADEALAGFCDLHGDLVRQVPGGAVRRRRTSTPKVAVLVGGGSGHYPAFAGLIGAGFADGAVVGNIFTSPSTQQAISVARAAHHGAGVVFTYGNYAGDTMNFGLAGQRLAEEGIRAEQMIVTDDIASAPVGEEHKRRGIAGDFVVFKVLGAAAERGDDLDEVLRLGTLANDRTRTIGTALSGCTFPGAKAPLFTVPEGKMGLGLGIHGEPGLSDEPLPTAHDLSVELVRRALAETPAGAGDRVAVILNSLGTTGDEELFVMWNSVSAELRAAGLTVVAPEVGRLVTSLDMGGVSLTLTWLTPELEELWNAPAHTPAYRKGAAVITGSEVAGSDIVETAAAVEPGTQESQRLAAAAVAGLSAVEAAIRDAEDELGRIDAVAGDGDHGRGMVRGLGAALSAARATADAAGGAQSVLAAAGGAWADRAGGTSGVLWGAGLRAAATELTDTEGFDPERVGAALGAFTETLGTLGGAVEGDKTMMDALQPFTRELRSALAAGQDLSAAWSLAATVATTAAERTADLVPRKGRARPLAERSLGTPDAGAVSFALITRTIGALLPTPSSSAHSNERN